MAPYHIALQQALDAQSKGDWASAAKLCERALLADPKGFDARHLLGFVLAQSGRHAEAMRAYQSAVPLNPNFGPLHNNIAASALELNENAIALAAARRAIELQPSFGPAYNNCAMALARADEHLAAVEMWDKAQCMPDAPSSIFRNKANSLVALGRMRDAIDCARRAVEQEQRAPAALNTLAFVLNAHRDFKSALAVSRDILKTDENNADALRNLSSALMGLREFSAAEPVVRALTARFPEDPDIANSLGLLLLGQRDFEAAEEILRALVAKHPHHVPAHLNLLCVLRDSQRFEAARRYINEWAHDLRSPGLAHTFGMMCLSLGLFERGWQAVEQRRRVDTWLPRALSGGEFPDLVSLRGKRAFLYAEQGLGDTIQFARYAELLAREAGSVELEVQAPLVALLGGLRGVRVIGAGATPSPYDGHLPLMSAPRLMGTRLDTIPADIPYVSADPLRVLHWAERIGSEGFKIGIAWQGNALSAADEGRSVPVGMFAGIGRIPGVRLISLQKNDGLEQLVDAPKELKIETLGDDFDAGQHAFLDTAAVMAHLDLVISCDTAIAHLAGAMGRPTWIALRHAPDWRWLLDRDDSPWYPTARLFRQPAPGDWRTVFDNIAQAVAAEVGEAWSDEYRLTEGQPANDHMASLAEARLNLGDAAGAIEICQAALEDNPGSFQARYVLAVALSASGRREEAIPHFKSSLDLRPRDVSLRVNYANTLNGVSRYEDALDVLEARPTGSSLLPVWLDAHAIASWGLGAFERALNDWREAIELAPHQNAFRLNWALSLYRQRRFREAVDVLTPLLQAHPDHEGGVNLQIQCLLAGQDVAAALAAARGAHQRLPRSPPIARALAACLIEDGAHSEAMDILTASTAAADASADVDLLIGKIHDRASEWSKAADAYAKALAKQPNLFPARLGLGVAQGKLGDHAAALESIIQAVELDPKDASALVQLGIARQNVGDWDGARKEFNEVSRLYPNNADVAWNCALHHLTMGDLKRGFDLYEARRHRSGAKLFRTPSGEEAKLRLQTIGKRIFLHAEQGLGDTIQFARYAELLAADALSVELEVQAPIVSLLSRLKGVRVIPAGASASEYDLHAPLMSLPRLFATRLETIPASVPYLFAEPERMAHWAQRLGPQGFKIAIAWQGSSFGAVDEGRSIPLRMFQAVSGIPGVRLISIQKNFGVEQLSVLSASMAVETLGPDFDAGGQAFLDTAAVMAHADLVITSDTSIAHLAGAMGRPVWIALKFSPDWRWFLERPDSPWYPTARLFRQPKPGDWESVFGEIAKEVQKVMNRR